MYCTVYTHSSSCISCAVNDWSWRAWVFAQVQWVTPRQLLKGPIRCQGTQCTHSILEDIGLPSSIVTFFYSLVSSLCFIQSPVFLNKQIDHLGTMLGPPSERFSWTETYYGSLFFVWLVSRTCVVLVFESKSGRPGLPKPGSRIAKTFCRRDHFWRIQGSMSSFMVFQKDIRAVFVWVQARKLCAFVSRSDTLGWKQTVSTGMCLENNRFQNGVSNVRGCKHQVGQRCVFRTIAVETVISNFAFPRSCAMETVRFQPSVSNVRVGNTGLETMVFPIMHMFSLLNAICGYRWRL